MATVHDQEDERRGFDYDSRGNEEAVSVTMARVDLRGAAEAIAEQHHKRDGRW